jgi:hypothetical protein
MAKLAHMVICHCLAATGSYPFDATVETRTRFCRAGLEKQLLRNEEAVVLYPGNA